MERLPSTGPNAEQITYWNETAAPKWLAHQRILDAQIRPLGQATMDRARIGAGEHVIDVGCGAGDTTLEIASRVGSSGEVLGIDVSTPLLERARERARETRAANVRFENADAQTHPFPERAFDAVFSRFGIMFFSDATRAFANLLRALREGGRLAFVCWQALDKNPWMAVPTAAAATVIPFPPRGPADAPGPFGFADPERIRRVVDGAGFCDLSVESLETMLDVGEPDLDRSVDFIVRMGPTGSALLQAGPDALPRVVAVVKQAVARYHTERGLHMPGAVWIVSARR
jgi:ubiquinone/menaquinone biosynthesis C-methylase UbiE